MSQIDDDENIDEAPHPRATTRFFGHVAAEAALLGAYRSGRMPHGVLISGPKGIGKATLAYRLARFVLAQPDPLAAAVLGAESLQVAPTNPVTRRIAAQAQPDLLVIERTVNEKGVLRNQIAVGAIRRAIPFCGSTSGEGGWPCAIIDSVEDLNRAGANALRKVLEEPPKRALLLLVAHSAVRVPPTLRSRCRVLSLRPLAEAHVAGAAAAAIEAEPDDPENAPAPPPPAGPTAPALPFLDEG